MAGQETFTHRQATSPSRRDAAWPQDGHTWGKTKGCESGARSESTARTTSGMTSPARWTTTRSPILHVPIADFILIVEGCPADKHTADVHRLQFGHRGQDPRPPHLNGNIQQQGRRLLRRKLPRNGEPRSPRRIAQRLLCLKVIELHDHAVDLVRQRLPFFTQRGVIGFHFFGTPAEAASGRRLEPKVTEPSHDLLILYSTAAPHRTGHPQTHTPKTATDGTR